MVRETLSETASQRELHLAPLNRLLRTSASCCGGWKAPRTGHWVLQMQWFIKERGKLVNRKDSWVRLFSFL